MRSIGSPVPPFKLKPLKSYSGKKSKVQVPRSQWPSVSGTGPGYLGCTCNLGNWSEKMFGTLMMNFNVDCNGIRVIDISTETGLIGLGIAIAGYITYRLTM